jgi:hypothetical protein
MAGFELTLYGRFWVTPKDKSLYLTDPDHVVLGEKADQGARSIVEGQSRLLSAVISGGMILDSSRVADDAQGQTFAKVVYSNPRLFAVANEGKIFRPLEGDTGNRATTVFCALLRTGSILPPSTMMTRNHRRYTFRWSVSPPI